MSKIGIQSQNGVIVDLGRILQKKPISYKLLGNALNLGIARTIRAQSPQTFLVLRTGGNWAVNDDGFIQRYADEAARIADPYLREGLCDLLEPPNEPVVQSVDMAKLLNERQVAYAHVMKQRGYRVGAYNFSVGNPDYPLWPFLQDGIRASDYWLLLHQYGAPNMDSDPANLAVRHRNVLSLLPSDVQANVKIGITESGIDLGSIGSAGGYRRMPQPSGDRRIIDVFLQQLSWYDGELANDPAVKFVNMFGYAMNEPWVGLGFDLAEVQEEREAFISWLKGGVVDLNTTNPPPVPNPPPQESDDMKKEDLIAAYSRFPALAKIATAKGMGNALGYEISFPSDGHQYVTQLYAGAVAKGGILVAEDGRWSEAKVYEADTFEPRTGTPPPPTGIQPYRFPPDLATKCGAIGEEGNPIAGQRFFRLSGASVRDNIGAFIVVTVIGKNGVPVIGQKVARLFPDGNGEVLQTDGSGTIRFQNGSNSAFTNPGTGPFAIFIVDDTAGKDEDSVPKRIFWQFILSDKVKSLGDFQGKHQEISIQYVEQ